MQLENETWQIAFIFRQGKWFDFDHYIYWAQPSLDRSFVPTMQVWELSVWISIQEDMEATYYLCISKNWSILYIIKLAAEVELFMLLFAK